MSSTTQSVIDDCTPHPTDPFWGRPHQNGSGQRAQIRPLVSDDLNSLIGTGRVGKDYRMQFGPHGSEDATVITPEQYANWQPVPRSDIELGAIRLYDWLTSHTATISNTDVLTNGEAEGVAVGINWGFNPPESAMVLMPVRGTAASAVANSIVGALDRLGITARAQLESGGWNVQFHTSQLAQLPA